MSTSNDPAATEPTSSPADENIPLPPPPQTPPRPRTTPEQLAAETARLDRVLVVLVLALAFLLGSFAVRNSDLWLHLAAGRALLQGQYNPFAGNDPFSYTGTGPWVNHAWLFDAVLYLLAQAGGGVDAPAAGVLLVVFRALLLTGLAVVLMGTHRPGRSLWAPVFCTALALLTLSPRALLQPVLFSYLFLGLTLYLLQRPRMLRAQGVRTLKPLASWWLLPLLFVLWVNLDSWFLLGPATVALWLIGGVLQQTFAPVRTGDDAPEPNEAKSLAMVLAVGVAACLLNPQHFRAFVLPPDLWSPALNTIRELEPNMAAQFSPFSEAYRARPDLGFNPAGMAYFALSALGLLSFVLCRGFLRADRLLVWVAFFVLSALNWRQVAIFAVVAGPITALNLQDYAARTFGTVMRTDGRWKEWSLGGRIVTLLVFAALVAAAWPGWLNAQPDIAARSRRAGWTVEPDPSYRRVALQLRAWREQGLLGPDDRGFTYTPELASYLTYYCPEEKTFFDFRYQLFPKAAKTFIEVRRTLVGKLLPGAEPGGRPLAAGDTIWQKVFRDEHVNHVIVHSLDTDSMTATVRMMGEWGQWVLLYTDGRTSVFGWTDPRPQARVPEWFHLARVRAETLAFGATPEQAPAEGPGRAVQRRDPLTGYTKPPMARPVAADEATFWNTYYQRMSLLWSEPAFRAMQITIWADAAAGRATVPGSLLAPIALAEYIVPPGTTVMPWAGQGPAAPLVLAIRAARRAVKENPDDVQAYLSLADNYYQLWQGVENRWAGGFLQRAAFLRQVQIATALQQALVLRPDSEDIHRRLKILYVGMGFRDFALDHLNEEMRYARQFGRQPAESPDDYLKRLENYEKQSKEFESDVQQRLNRYELDALNQPLVAKAGLAMQLGLAKKALDELRKSDPTQPNFAQGVDLQVQLLLRTGQLEELRGGFTAEFRSWLGSETYPWYKLVYEAADGNYHEASVYLEELVALFEDYSARATVRLVHAQTFGGALGAGSFYYGVPGIGSLPALYEVVSKVATYRTLRGLVAVEQGDNTAAQTWFEKALNTGGDPARLYNYDGRAVALRYAELLKAE